MITDDRTTDPVKDAAAPAVDMMIGGGNVEAPAAPAAASDMISDRSEALLEGSWASCEVK